MPGHGLGVDFASGLGLVLPAMPLDAPALTRGGSADAAIGDDLLMLAHGGIGHSLATRLDERKTFAGYWDYVLDDALYPSPADPSSSGGAVVDMRGRLIGIGSLLVQQAGQDDYAKHATCRCQWTSSSPYCTTIGDQTPAPAYDFAARLGIDPLRGSRLGRRPTL